MAGALLQLRPTAPDSTDRDRRSRRLWTFAAVVIALLISGEALNLYLEYIGGGVGQDYRFYQGIGLHWLADGTYYLPDQLTGQAYPLIGLADVLYPPTGLLLFVPVAVLPWPVWWIVPIGVSVYVLRWLNPPPWSWVVMLVLLAYPRAIGAFLFGNSDMWAMAGVFAGIRWGWPAVLLTIKPSLAPFALVGVTHRSWWIGLACLALVSLLMLPLWFDYVTAIRNVAIGADYSLGSVPLLLVPIVAWFGSRGGIRALRQRRTPSW